MYVEAYWLPCCAGRGVAVPACRPGGPLPPHARPAAQDPLPPARQPAKLTRRLQLLLLQLRAAVQAGQAGGRGEQWALTNLHKTHRPREQNLAKKIFLIVFNCWSVLITTRYTRALSYSLRVTRWRAATASPAPRAASSPLPTPRTGTDTSRAAPPSTPPSSGCSSISGRSMASRQSQHCYLLFSAVKYFFKKYIPSFRDNLLKSNKYESVHEPTKERILEHSVCTKPTFLTISIFL